MTTKSYPMVCYVPVDKVVPRKKDVNYIIGKIWSDTKKQIPCHVSYISDLCDHQVLLLNPVVYNSSYCNNHDVILLARPVKLCEYNCSTGGLANMCTKMATGKFAPYCLLIDLVQIPSLFIISPYQTHIYHLPS